MGKEMQPKSDTAHLNFFNFFFFLNINFSVFRFWKGFDDITVSNNNQAYSRACAVRVKERVETVLLTGDWGCRGVL